MDIVSSLSLLLLGTLLSLTPPQTIPMTSRSHLPIMRANQHVWTVPNSCFLYEFKEYASEHRKSPTMYQCAVGHLVFRGLSFKPAWNSTEHWKRISAFSLSHKWTPPAYTCEGTTHACLTLKIAPCVLQNANLKCTLPSRPEFIFTHVFFLARQDREHRMAVGYGFDVRQTPPLSKGK